MTVSQNLAAPPNCGKRLLPTLVDEIAVTDPGRTFASIPKSSDLVDGFMDISYRKFARAVNRCAWWLTKELGEHTEPKPVLYLGPLDLRYLIIILAAAKAGHIVSLGRKIEVPLSDPDHPRSGIFQLTATASRPICPF